MMICALCGFATPTDDAAVSFVARGRCICLRCYARETGSARRMPPSLVREVSACVTVDL